MAAGREIAGIGGDASRASSFGGETDEAGPSGRAQPPWSELMRVEQMKVMACACGHSFLNQLSLGDLVIWNEETARPLASLTGASEAKARQSKAVFRGRGRGRGPTENSGSGQTWENDK